MNRYLVERNPLKGFLFAFGAELLLAFNYVNAKHGLSGFNPESFTLIWTISATFFALIYICLTGKASELVPPPETRKKIGLLGVTTGVGMLLCWAGLARLDPAFAAFLWRFLPLLTIILSYFFLGERLKFKAVFPVGVMLAGGALSAAGRWEIVGLGIILTLASSIAVAIQMLTAKMLITKINPIILIFYRAGIGSFIVLGWGIFFGNLDFNVPLEYWLVTILGAVLGPGIGFLLSFQSYRYWDLTHSSIVITTEPVFVLLFAYLFLGTLPQSQALWGGFFILLGAFWLVLVQSGKLSKKTVPVLE